jgi:molecular chaperone DnaK
VTIHVLQGERKMAGDNTSLGMFNLIGIPPAPMGIPQIEVTFDIDRNGILNVTAKDLGTGKEQTITITASTKLSDSEIDRMVEDAKKYADHDQKAKEKAETKNNAEHLVYTSKQVVKDLGEKLTNEQKGAIEKGAVKLQEAIDEDDYEAIKKETETLTKVLNEASTAVYQAAAQAQAEGGQGGPGTGPGNEPDEEPRGKPKKGEKVVDADYEVVDEDDQ